jgi:TatA/E family protein of Tat protein translocase
MFHLALIGTTELIWIAVILVLLFGARKLPELARSMGSSITAFKKGLKEDGEREQIPEGGPEAKKGPSDS